MKRRILAALAILTLLIVCAAFSASASDTVTANSAPEAYDGTTACPHCGKTDITWIAMENKDYAASSDIHLVVESNENLDVTSRMDLNCSSADAEVVIWIKGSITFADGIALFMGNNYATAATNHTEVWLIGGGGSIGGTGYNNENNGNLRVFPQATLYITNALTIEFDDPADNAVRAGVLDINKGTVYMQGGTINGYNTTNASTKGGAVYLRKGETGKPSRFVMTGGTVNGGNVPNGGAFYMGSAYTEVDLGGTANVYGGTVTGKGGVIYQTGTSNTSVTIHDDAKIFGGTAVSGGTMYVTGALDMQGGTVSGGTATNGGAFYVASGTAALKAGTVTGSAATNYGGGVYAEGGNVKIGCDATNYPDGPAFIGCHANSRGGALYVVATGMAEMASGTISDCYVGSSGVGGAVYVRGESDGTRGTFDMSGGTITVAGDKAGNSKGIRVQGGIFNMSGTATVVSGGNAESGSGIDCLGGKVSLDGAAQIYTPANKKTFDILIRNSGTPTLTVKETWTGTATVRYNKIVDDKSYTPGGVIDSKYGVSTGDFSGQLYLQSESTLPRIYGKEGKLVFSDVAVCNADGMIWCKDNADAVATCGSISNTYIKLFGENPLTLTGKDVAVDFNGKTVAVNGSGKLYGFDSTAGVTAGTAKVTATAVTVEPFVKSPASGENFIAVTEDGVSTFHVIKPVITGVSLRPENASMYYSAQVTCDETISGYITAYGIAVQLQEMPGADFEATSLYSRMTKPLTPGNDFTGVLVREIMKDGALNADRAERMVYANAYVTVEVNGQSHTYLASDSNGAAAMSFKTLVGKANSIYRSLEEKQQTGINALYQKYKTVMTDGSWRVNNIMAANGDDALAGDKDGLKILMIGNSLSVDAGRMLSYVFATEGYDNVRISTMYKSGCKLYEHANFIRNNEAAYTFYNNAYTDSAAVVADPSLAVPKTASKKTLLYGLQQDDWDIIVMQQGSSQAAQADTYNEDIQTIIDYVLENDKNPETRPTFVWNSIWGYPYNADELAENGADYVTLLKRNTGSDTADAATQIKMVDMITQAAKDKILTNDNFAYVIPGGTAFIHGCAALSNAVMYNDYIHASDLGRMMVSYVWYSAITGKPVEDFPDVVPGVLRRSGADRAVTQAEEAALLDAIEKAFTAPYTMPEGFQN